MRCSPLRLFVCLVLGTLLGGTRVVVVGFASLPELFNCTEAKLLCCSKVGIHFFLRGACAGDRGGVPAGVK